MIIAGQIEVEKGLLASGGFSDVRRGNYRGHLVAVRTMRVTTQDDILKIRKVSDDDMLPSLVIDRLSLAIL